ncbi:hypothetical protein Tco_0759878, partial [Tanacetum coccineum]
MQLIQKHRDDKKCIKKVEPSSRSKVFEDIISIGSFVEALVLNHYVLVRKILEPSSNAEKSCKIYQGKSYNDYSSQGKKHGRMMLDSIDNGPLVYPTIEEDRQTRLKKYSELTEAQQLQDDCDAFWLKHSFISETPVKLCTPVRIEAPSELPKDNFRENQNAPTFNQLFEINELKAQSQEKDTVIRKLKDRIKSLSGKDSVKNVKKDIDEIKTINIELEHSVAKLLFENENSVETSDLNAQFQEKVFSIAVFKNELRKLKGKHVVNTAVSKSSATIAPGMFKLDKEPISHSLKNNRDT